MNMMALRYGDDIIVIDAGLMFPEQELLGVDIVIPDITYLKQNKQQGARDRADARARRPHRRDSLHPAAI